MYCCCAPALPAQVGPLLAEQQQVVDCLLHLLGSYQYEDSEELVLNCVCALTNLSFYHGHPDNKVDGGAHVLGRGRGVRSPTCLSTTAIQTTRWVGCHVN